MTDAARVSMRVERGGDNVARRLGADIRRGA